MVEQSAEHHAVSRKCLSLISNTVSHVGRLLDDSDFAAQDAGTRLVGKLFNLCGEVSTKDDGKIDIYDSDAVAFAK